MQVIHKNNRSNEAKNAKSLGLTCFQFAFALLLLSSHTLLEISGSGIAFTTDACSESRENNCFHATITGPSSENTLSKAARQHPKQGITIKRRRIGLKGTPVTMQKTSIPAQRPADRRISYHGCLRNDNRRIFHPMIQPDLDQTFCGLLYRLSLVVAAKVSRQQRIQANVPTLILPEAFLPVS